MPTYIETQNESRKDYKLRKTASQVTYVLNSRPTKGIFVLIIFSILAPLLVYYFVFDKGSYPPKITDSCSVDKTYRISCGKPENTTLNYCSSINCCFDNSTKRCFHYLPSKYYYFETTEDSVYQRSLKKSPFGKYQAEKVVFTLCKTGENTFQITLHDFNATLKQECTDVQSINYFVSFTKNPLSVEVVRNSTNDLLLTTAKGPMIISENYWEWSFQLTDEYLFGLGQTLIDFKENSTFTKVIYGNSKDHNTLPLFMAYKNKMFHGLIVRHSGPLEITVLPSKLVTLKSLAGGQIVLELSLGPTIQEVVKQQKDQTSLINGMDLSTLGVHICREGSDTNLKKILNTVKKEINDYTDEISSAGNYVYQYESDCFHENLFIALQNEGNNENSNDISDMIQLIQDNIVNIDHRFTLSLSPQIAVGSVLYNTTRDLNVFFKNISEDYQGEFLKTKVVYPYFNHPNKTEFIQIIINEVRQYFGNLTTQFLLGNNWPSDDSFEMNYTDSLQYLSEDLIAAMSFTVPWNMTSEDNFHFMNHNDYGALQLEQIKAELNESNFVTASHTFDTLQPIMIQNVNISWTNFQKSITTTLYNSIFGFPLTSIPVCGSTTYFNSSHESLCLRWYYMAATTPIFRISSDLPRRDPISLSSMSNYLAEKAKWAIDFRYSLQYYFYTVLSKGEPLMRPMFYDFSDDTETFALVEQYMVGGDLLVAHPTLPDQSLLKVYLPKGVSTWFEFWGGDTYGPDSGKDGWINLNIVESDWVGFIREGAIISLVEINVDDNNLLNVNLKVALMCNTTCDAIGTLKIDNLNLITFSSTDTQLKVEKQQSGEVNFILNQVEIFKPGSDLMRLQTENKPKLTDIEICQYSVESLSFIC